MQSLVLTALVKDLCRLRILRQCPRPVQPLRNICFSISKFFQSNAQQQYAVREGIAPVLEKIDALRPDLIEIRLQIVFF